MVKMKNNCKFLDKASAKFGNLFDYSLVEYINAKTKVKIICKEHGVFEQTPDKHLQATYPCPVCNNKSRKGRHKKSSKRKSCKTLEDFKDQLKFSTSEENYKISYQDFQGFTKGQVIVTCTLHDSTKIFNPPRALLQVKTPCTECSSELKRNSNTKSYQDFLKKASVLFNGKYTYPVANIQDYHNRESLLTVVCPVHGSFLKRAQKHLSGQGCFDCCIQTLISQGKLKGGYSEDYFINHPEEADTLATLYYLKVGKVFKIGITTNLYNRLKSIKSSSKNDVALLYSEEGTLQECYTKEQKILTENYKVRTYRKWSTELFSEDILSSFS